MDSTIVFDSVVSKNKTVKNHGSWGLVPRQFFFTHCWDEILNNKQFKEDGVY